MAHVDVYKLDGMKAGDVTLDDAVFALPHNADLVHQVYVAQSANRRSGSAHTKVRKSVVVVGKSHGSKRVQAMHVQARFVTRSGAVVAQSLVHSKS